MAIRYRIAQLTSGLLLLAAAPSAHAAGFTAECVSDYSLVGQSNLPAACVSASGLVTTLTGAGHSNPSFWANNDVWDTDMVDVSVFASAGDSSYTDRPDARLYYFAGHGYCNYGKSVSGASCSGSCPTGQVCESGVCVKYCSSDSDCVAPKRCQVGAPNSAERYCSAPTDAFIKTSSTVDLLVNNQTDITTQVRFGESASSGAWAAVGTDGGVEVLYLDSSCPMQPAFHWYRYNRVFAGLHLALGHMSYVGDTISSPYRGTNYANRLLAGQPVAVAMKNTFLAEQAATPTNPPEGGYPFYGLGCAVAVACARDTLAAQLAKTGLGWQRLQSETWPNGTLPPNTSSPNYCPYIETCNFSISNPLP